MKKKYITKDSGKRQNYKSGMRRDLQDDKVRYDLVYDGPMFKRWAELLTRGAVKYDPRNWMKANGQEEMDRFRASAARHFAQWMNSEDDEDHASAILFNVNGFEYLKNKINK